MNLNDMQLFAVIADKMSISAAARELAIPKSRVSRRLLMLEEELGTRLIERNTRNMRLTETGARLLVHCKRIVEEQRHAIATVAELNDEPQGVLTVSASVSMGQHIIAPRLAEFMRLYPKIELKLMLDNRRVDLISEGYDVALRVGSLDDSTLISRRIGGDQIGLYASPTYLADNPPITCFESLAQHKLVIMGDMQNRANFKMIGAQGDEHYIANSPVVEVNDLTVVRDLVLQGAGYAPIPTFLVTEALKTGRLQRILHGYSTQEFGYYAVYPSRFGLSRKTKAFIDFFTEVMKEE